MKITKIDIIPIRPRLASRYRGREVRFQGVEHRTVYKLQTDNGLVGYGDHRLGGLPRAAVEPLIGRDPFDFINNTLDPGLGGALYDLMGKYLEVPAYKLMGQKVRDAVSVAAWTAQSSPAEFAGEIERAAAQGYRRRAGLALPDEGEVEGDESLGAEDGRAEAGDDEIGGNDGTARRGNAGCGHDPGDEDEEDETDDDKHGQDDGRHAGAPQPDRDEEQRSQKTKHSRPVGQELFAVVDVCGGIPRLQEHLLQMNSGCP